MNKKKYNKKVVQRYNDNEETKAKVKIERTFQFGNKSIMSMQNEPKTLTTPKPKASAQGF